MEIVGHRGAAGEAPENTIAGCHHAIERGVRHIEIDLRLSADGQLVVLHDKTTNRTTGKRSAVARLSAAELAALDARADGPPWPRKKDCGIPTLDLLIESTRRSLRSYQLEVKPDSKSRLKQIASLLAERFPTARSASKFVVTSSNYYIHEYLRELAPHIPRGMVVMRPNAISALSELDCDLCAIHWSACSPYLVRQMRKADVHISVWTVNDAQMIKNLYRMKIDSVITDYPSMAIPLLAALRRR